MLDRRTFACGLAAGLAPLPGNAAAGRTPICGHPAGGSALAGPADWDRVYARHWGGLGPQSRTRIETMVHAADGVYDDRHGVFAWVVHYWIRAWVVMARLTGRHAYMQSCVSLIDYMLDHTDARRIRRGEIEEHYLRDPLGLGGSGQGGPFWQRQGEVSVLDTGQITRAILGFVDLVFTQPLRWRAYRERAGAYLLEAMRAVDAFDADWRGFGEGGSYFYRDSGGSGRLGSTPTAFNQSATMVSAHLAIHRWRPSPSRADKVRRLARHWIDDYAVLHADGTVTWRYILHPDTPEPEDVDHATTDLDFLVSAYLSGLTDLKSGHMDALARTFLSRVHDGGAGTNRYVDGASDPGWTDHFNAAIGWIELARFAPGILPVVQRIFDAHYPPRVPAGVMWARPMLGWANLLAARRPC